MFGLENMSITEYLLMLLLLNLIFQVKMIFVDAAIAFTVPAYMVEKRFKKNANKLMKVFFPILKEKIEDMIEQVIQRMDRRLDKIVTNEIPHVMDEKLEKLKEELPELLKDQINAAIIPEDLKEQFDSMKRMMGSVMSIKRTKDRQVKATKRLITLTAIKEQQPAWYSAIMGMKAAGGFTSEINQMLDLIGEQIHGTSQAMPVLQANAPQAGSIQPVQTQAQNGIMAEVNTLGEGLTDDEYEETDQRLACAQLEEMGIVAPEVIAHGKKIRKMMKKEKKGLNGKTKEK